MKADKLRSLRLKDIEIKDSFWGRYTQLVKRTMIPYQWDVLNGRVCDESSCLKNFRIAAGLEKGDYSGVVFQDTDIYKWLEAVAYSLETNPDTELETLADGAIDLIAKAQRSDGYLNTYYTLVEPEKRWSNLIEAHELYSAGHLIEAAVAYYNATGKKKLLDTARRLADLIDSVFGRGEGKIKGYSGHPEIELALVKLYRVTGDEKYRALAKYFIDERGKKPNYFEREIEKRGGNVEFSDDFKNYDLKYSQSHIPPKDQRIAEGHAVRAMYLYCAMADLAHEYKDAELMESCEELWESAVNKRMYITGSIGSSGHRERFTADYDLPNDSNYSETCASIGLALFALRMTMIKRDGRYMDIVERALYNTLLSGTGLEGNRYFYVNPLEVWPETCLENTSKAHVKPVRQRWFDVACCPTNAARTLASLGQYIYLQDDTALYVNLFIDNSAGVSFGGHSVNVDLKSSYLCDGRSELIIEGSCDFQLMIRVPGHVNKYAFTIDGRPVSPEIRNGYAVIEGPWEGKRAVGIEFDTTPKFIASNPQVRANAGKVALMKGPLVYCLEEVDNGPNLSAVFVDINTPIREKEGDFGVPELHYEGRRLVGWGEELYAEASFSFENVSLKAVPYGLWGNRQPGEMLVWQRALLR